MRTVRRSVPQLIGFSESPAQHTRTRPYLELSREHHGEAIITCPAQRQLYFALSAAKCLALYWVDCTISIAG